MKKYLFLFIFITFLFDLNLSFADKPDFVNKLITNTSSKYYELNSRLEFVDEKWLKNRLWTFACYSITSSNYTNYKSFWYILKTSSWKYCFTSKISKESKIYYSSRNSYFKTFDYDNPIVLENNNYYAYKFSKYYFFEDLEWFYLSDFTKLWYTKDNLIILKKDSKYYIVKDFTKIKLVSNKLLSWVKNKSYFVKLIYDDLEKSNISETDILNILEKIKKTSLSFKSNDKIKEAYAWILNNISYFSWDLNSSASTPIFSWLYTYQNRIWVCDWYSKLFSYLLMFSWIEDVEVKTWFVINSELFPDFWHAWVRIWWYYYDPTFDDPIWRKSNKTSEEYKYFKLPKDILYADRFDYADMDSSVKKYLLESRKLMVEKKFYDVAQNYIYSDYLILKKYIFKINNWIKFNEKITINKAKTFLNYLEVNDNDWYYTFIDSKWVKKYLKNIIYYNVTDSSLENILSSNFGFNIKNLYLIKWIKWNWKYEYRLSNNIKF